MRPSITRAALVLTAALGLAGAFWQPAAASTETTPPSQEWRFNGLFGTLDRAAAQRGFQVYSEVCAACHSLRLLSYRNLRELGFSADEVAAIAAQVQVADGPNDQGEMFQRSGRPADRFHSPFPNDAAARASNNGALPPDLSVIVKARENGPNYVFAMLTGFGDPPPDMTLMPGMNYNRYFPGHQMGMPNILREGGVTYADGTTATVHQQAWDVVNFLTWAAEPAMEQRRQMGVRVVLFLIVFAGMMYAVKRKVWADAH